jgi:hypothetical protein
MSDDLEIVTTWGVEKLMMEMCAICEVEQAEWIFAAVRPPGWVAGELLVWIYWKTRLQGLWLRPQEPVTLICNPSNRGFLIQSKTSGIK